MVLKSFLAGCIIVLAARACAQPCPSDATQRYAQRAVALDQQLRSMQVETIAGDIPPGVVAPLEAFKQALVTTIDVAMRCRLSAESRPSQVESALSKLLDAGVEPKPNRSATGMDDKDKMTDAIGDNLAISVKPLPDHPDLISIQVSFGLVCGDDNMLLLYQRAPNGWLEQMTWRSSNINTMSQGFGDFFVFAPVPGGPDHPLLIAVAHGHPWCTSRFSEFHLDLLAPETASTPQKTLAHVDGGFDRTGEPGPTLRTRTDGFELKLKTPDSDLNVFQRVAIYRYRTTSDTLERQQPIANNARDFVDAWIAASWAEAAEWSLDDAKSLKATHDLFDFKLHKDSSTASAVETYGPVRACTQDPTRFQVEMDLYDKPKLYAHVRLKGSTCLMIDMTSAPDPTCTGPDLMKPAKSAAAK
jgi:hypothetical protein